MNTSPTILPLDETCITSPSKVHLAVTGAAMLWPHDPDARERTALSWVVHEARELMRARRLAQEAILELAERGPDALPMQDLTQALLDPIKKGFFAGQFLRLALTGRNPDGTKPNLGEVNKFLARRYTGKKATDTTAISQIWKDYRPVAHYWAAHLDYCEATGRSDLPCAVSEFGNFLVRAESWRVRGEAGKPHRNAPSTVLDPSETVRLPPEIKFRKIY
ncbi:MAG: hypothetical protein Q7T45_09740 [Bradyrhizobium sp.]|uniref:hypothetical protein n=1 Tax=Bradyrhizobium sp. TaxID=376 RepID=UPI00271D2CD0|nr:hypothetical protein [Bradyrhizobium sp.]MDO8398089.1 hypothetical protein [Bradyrhizobium sp.]